MDKEVEWTIIFDFPATGSGTIGFVPMNDGSNKLICENHFDISGCMTWNNKKEAERYAEEHCKGYNWYLFPTVIECTIS